MHVTTATAIQECAEEAVKESIKLHGEACDVVIVCVPMDKGNRVLQKIQEALGFIAED